MSEGFRAGETFILARPRRCEVATCTRIAIECWLCEQHYWWRVRTYGAVVSNAQISLINMLWPRQVPGEVICRRVCLPREVVWRVLFECPWPGEVGAFQWGWECAASNRWSSPTGSRCRP